MFSRFYKYHGAGNDFVIIDGRGQALSPPRELINSICDRHKGVGADGLMILEDDPEADFLMRYFNADGAESTMCGNGGRCIGLFAHHLGIGGLHKNFVGADGPHGVDVIYTEGDGGVLSLGMSDVHHLEHLSDKIYFLDTGSPHYVEFVNDVTTVDVARRGAEVRYSDRFSREGTNVNFVQVVSDGYIRVRTYERGVEAETLACGTGATASVIAAITHTNSGVRQWRAAVEGGELSIVAEPSAGGGFTSITLTGPAKKVFEGEFSSFFNL